MHTITKEQLDALLSHLKKLSISIYLPTQPGLPGLEQNPIRFKSLLGETKRELMELGLDEGRVHDYLDPLSGLVEKHGFWEHQESGLAVLYAGDEPTKVHLPYDVPELAIVNERYHLRPLLRLFEENGCFYVLSLSEATVRLFQGDCYGLSEVTLPDVPRSFDEFTRFDDPERQLQFHTGTAERSSSGQRAAVFHGQGGGIDKTQEKRRLAGYCSAVSTSVARRLGGQTAPLLIAATDPLLGLYRQANTYAGLREEPIHHHADALSPEKLHAHALEALEPVLDKNKRQAIEQYSRLVGTSQSSDDLERNILATHDGQVETLLIRQDCHRWGRFHPEERTIERHDTRRPGDEDLLDRAGVEAQAHGSAIFTLTDEEMPADTETAATFRFVT